MALAAGIAAYSDAATIVRRGKRVNRFSAARPPATLELFNVRKSLLFV
jgi:hypothetical protein